MAQEKIRIYNVQNYCVHDGPGIRTTIFLKGCAMSCQWCCNPESQSGHVQLKHSTARCKSCGRCVLSCNQTGVKIDADSNPDFNFSICNKCETRECLNTCYNDALEIMGKDLFPSQLVDIIMKDKDFYVNSGGGVTFSGGECLLQGKALMPVFEMCKKENIHIAVETCGYVPEELIELTAPLIDLYLYDFKIINPIEHKKYTSKDNALIINNLKKVAKLNKAIIARVPLIPNVTDTNDNIDQIITLCTKNGIKEATLSPYHELGISKYGDLGMKYKFKNVSTSLMQENMQENMQHNNLILNKFLAAGIECSIL